MFNIIFDLYKELVPHENQTFSLIPKGEKKEENRCKILKEIIRSIGRELEIDELKKIHIEFNANPIEPLAGAVGSSERCTVYIPKLWLLTKLESNLMTSSTDLFNRTKPSEVQFNVLSLILKEFYYKIQKNSEKAKKAIHFILAHELVHVHFEDSVLYLARYVKGILGAGLTMIGLYAFGNFSIGWALTGSVVAFFAIKIFTELTLIRTCERRADAVPLDCNPQLAEGAIYLFKKFKRLQEKINGTYGGIGESLQFTHPSQLERIRNARLVLANNRLQN